MIPTARSKSKNVSLEIKNDQILNKVDKKNTQLIVKNEFSRLR